MRSPDAAAAVARDRWADDSLREMKKHFALCLLVAGLGCILGGCAADQQATADNPNGVESSGVKSYSEASVFYGHSAGH